MPGQKRRYLSSPNPVQHIHDDAVMNEDPVSSMTSDDGIAAAQPELGDSDVTREGVDAGAAAAAIMIAAHAHPTPSVPTSKAEHQPPAASSDVVVPRRNKKPTTYLRNKKDSIKGVFDELENISLISKFATEKFKTFDKQDDVADAIRMIWRHLKLKQ